MSKVMVIGYGPLPRRGLKFVNGSCLRTRQFIKGIAEADCHILLYTLPIHGSEASAEGSPSLQSDEYEGIAYKRFSNHSGEFAVSRLGEELSSERPDAIVGVGAYPSYVASMLPGTCPLWCDLNGSWMAAMQARCYVEEDDKRLESAWSIERAVLRRLDRFSTVSRPHLYAVTGKLAALGRLNRHTFDYFFGSPIPNSFYVWEEGDQKENDFELRGKIVPPTSFVMLWSGGFKPWHDIETMMQGVEELMKRYEEVHLVATGGATDETDAAVYGQFQQAVERSPHRQRFHLLGWVGSEQLASIYREADLGLNVDAAAYETIFGGRTRINTMAGHGLAVLTTVGTEISEWLDDAHAALTVEIGDWNSIVEAVEAWIDQKEKLGDYSRRAMKMMNSDFTDSATTAPLRHWLREPRNAPDNAVKIRTGGASLDYLPSVCLNSLEAQVSRLDLKPTDENPRPIPSTSLKEDGAILRRLKRLFSSESTG